jgi:DNA-binding NtrC family response regulator
MENKGSILLVDDNINLCKTMGLVLKRKGFEVMSAEEGPRAIELVKERSFDIIFMDIKMPLMNGVEVYKRIKKIRPEITVIMMTAYAVEDLIQEALQEGAYGVIYKPLNIDEIVDLIDKTKQQDEGAFVLIVDDDQNSCTVLKNILEKRGHEVGIAHKGEEAIEMAKNKVYKVILIDMKLPTINGLETYFAIKEVNPEAIAIMMTGYRQEMEDLVDTALKNSAYTCLYKPIDMSELIKLVDELWARKKSQLS